MNRNIIIGRNIYTFIVFVTFVFISAVLTSPLFEETSKGGFFIERDNPGHIFSSLLFIAVLSLAWIAIDKNKDLPNQVHHLRKFSRYIYTWVSSDMLRLVSLVIIMTLIGCILLIPTLLGAL